MTVTLAQLSKIMMGAPASRLEPYLPFLNAAMEEAEINTPARVAAFLAQLGHESMSLQYMQEIASGAAYDKRADLGNTKPEAIAAAKAHNTTPGRFYKGHGPIQITGYSNHRDAGVALGIDAVNNPSLLATPEHGFRGATWFWATHNLNALADQDTEASFKAITKRINGGLNGWPDRLKRWKVAKSTVG